MCSQRGVLEQSGAPEFDENLKTLSLFPSSGKASAISNAKVCCLQVSAVQVHTLLGTTRRRTTVYTVGSLLPAFHCIYSGPSPENIGRCVCETESKLIGKF